MTQPQEILEAALGLPEDERFQLVTPLLASFPNDRFGVSRDDPDLWKNWTVGSWTLKALSHRQSCGMRTESLR